MQQSSAPGGSGLTGIEKPWYRVDSPLGCDKLDGVPVANDAEPRETAVGSVFSVFLESTVGRVLLCPFLASLAVGVDGGACGKGCPWKT